MTTDDIKQITKVVRNEINQALEPVNKKLDEHTGKLDELTGKVDSHTASLSEIEATLKGYGDMYKINNDNNEKLKKRVEKVESHLGIIPRE